MTEFTILEINQINPEEISLRIKTDNQTKNYQVYFRNGKTHVSDELEILMRDKDFNYHRQFGNLLSEFQKNKKVHLPFNFLTSS